MALTDEEILERLVALNAERAAEERRGLVRWLRPEFQNPRGASQTAMDTGEGTATVAAVGMVQKSAWPEGMPEQAKAVRAALSAVEGVVTAEQLAEGFKGRVGTGWRCCFPRWYHWCGRGRWRKGSLRHGQAPRSERSAEGLGQAAEHLVTYGSNARAQSEEAKPSELRNAK